MNSAVPTEDFPGVVVEMARRERPLVSNPVKRYLDGVSSLPPAPTLVTELLTLFREPDHDLDRVVQLISYEPSLTAQILRTCNSVYFAGQNPPEDIFEAVSRLGFYRVYCMVVSLFGSRTKSLEGAEKGLNLDELWRHSVAVAVSASVVAEEAGLARPVAFTAGLLHDVGKLVLAGAEGVPYARLIQGARDGGVLLTALERSALEIDHAELGGELMFRWNLPPDVVAAVRYHHDLEAATPYEHLTAAVQVGDLIAHQLYAEDLTSADILLPSISALGVLDLEFDDLPRLVGKSRAEIEKVTGMLEI